MKVSWMLLTALALGQMAQADFRYTTTTKSATGLMAAVPEQSSTTYLKGQKLKIDNGTTSTIMDFGAQTITQIDNRRKTYFVSKFNDMGDALEKSGAEFSIDVKETGQRKSINGYNASEVVLTTEVSVPQSRQMGMKMRMEMDIWVSQDVPGSQELASFFQKNANRFPWASMAGGGRGDPGMQKAMAEVQRKMAALKGVPVLQVMKISTSGNDEQMARMQQGMAQARQQLEEMKRQGKLPPQLEKQLEAMEKMGSPGAASEITHESSGFSASPIADAMFDIPAGYQQSEHR